MQKELAQKIESNSSNKKLIDETKARKEEKRNKADEVKASKENEELDMSKAVKIEDEDLGKYKVLEEKDGVSYVVANDVSKLLENVHKDEEDIEEKDESGLAEELLVEDKHIEEFGGTLYDPEYAKELQKNEKE